MGALEELGLAEGDLGGLMEPYLPKRRRRADGGPSAAVMESVRGCVERGMSIAEAVRNHGLTARELRPATRSGWADVGLCAQLWEDEAELAAMLAEGLA